MATVRNNERSQRHAVKRKPVTAPKRKGDVCFESLDQAASVLGVSRDLLKAAKRAGCPAFRSGGRIFGPEFTEWIKDHSNLVAPTAPASMREAKLSEEVRKLRIVNDQKEGVLIRRADVIATLTKFFAWQLALLRQRLENEYPSVVAALGEPAQARVYGKRLVDELCKQHQEQIATWTI